MDQVELDFARLAGNAGAEAGMRAALAHADSLCEGWGDRAATYLDAFLYSHPGASFVAPEVRAWSSRHGLPAPPTAMAWGGVFRRAAHAGKIRRVGYRPYGDETMHTQSVSEWVQA